MSTTVILVPIIIANWPAITAAVAAAAAGMGLSIHEQAKEEARETAALEERTEQVEVELAKAQSLAKTMAGGREIVATKDGVELRVKSDAGGKCVVCASGRGKSKAKLEEMANEFAGRITQVYMYNKVMTELKAKGFKLAGEEVMKDKSIRINVRNEVD